MYTVPIGFYEVYEPLVPYDIVYEGSMYTVPIGSMRFMNH